MIFKTLITTGMIFSAVSSFGAGGTCKMKLAFSGASTHVIQLGALDKVKCANAARDTNAILGTINDNFKTADKVYANATYENPSFCGPCGNSSRKIKRVNVQVATQYFTDKRFGSSVTKEVSVGSCYCKDANTRTFYPFKSAPAWRPYN